MTTYKQAADFLFHLLDEIDTASDMAKGDDKAYRAMVELLQRRRFEVAVTDGYSVTFKQAADVAGGEQDNAASSARCTPLPAPDGSSAAGAAPLASTAEAFDAAWSAIQHSELIEIKTVRRKLSIHELRTFLRLVLTPHLETRAALKKLAFAARTTGGTAGRDDALCAACDEAEAAIAKHTEG